MRVVDLRQKEVINICTCKTLGCPIDVEFNPKTGHLTGLVLPGPVKFCGFFCHGEDFVIPWDRICQIGNDIILVEIPEKEKKQPLINGYENRIPIPAESSSILHP